MRYFYFFLLFVTSLFSHQRLYLGTDFCYQDFKERFISRVEGKEKTFFRSYKAGYDLEKPSFFYLGLEFQQNKNKISEKAHKNHEKVHSDFINYEGRIGYSLLSQTRIYIIPFIGAGEHRWVRKNNPFDFDKIKYHWVYVAYGARLNFLLSDSLQLGFRAKLLHLVKGSVKLYEDGRSASQDLYEGSNKYKFDLKKKLCYEFELPIIFSPQTFYPFDVALVPYYQKYILNDSVSSLYLQNSLFSSKNRTFDAGLRLEMGFNF